VEAHCQTVRLACEMATRLEGIQETDSQFPDALVQYRRA
jgi:hypothetical protein